MFVLDLEKRDQRRGRYERQNVQATIHYLNVSPSQQLRGAADGSRLYGLDAELYVKEEQKREANKEWETQLAEWIEITVGEPLAEKEDLWLSLKNGVVLCKLVNKIKPGTIKAFNTTRLLPLLEMDNIQIYLKALWQLGVNSRDLFVTPDLYKKKGMSAVLQSIYALNLLAPKLGYQGPLMGDEISKASQANTKKARTWKEVETVPKKVRVDELMSTVGGPEGLIHSLQLKVAEQNAEITNIKGEKVSLLDEVRGLKAKLGQGNLGESVDEMYKAKRQLVEEQKERERLQYELMLVSKRVALSSTNPGTEESAELRKNLEVVQQQLANSKEELLSAREEMDRMQSAKDSELRSLNAQMDDQQTQSASLLASKEADIQRLRLNLEDQTSIATNTLRLKQAEALRAEEQLSNLRIESELERKKLEENLVQAIATKDEEIQNLKLALASKETVSTFEVKVSPEVKPVPDATPTKRRPPPPPSSPEASASLPPPKSPRAPPPPPNLLSLAQPGNAPRSPRPPPSPTSGIAVPVTSDPLRENLERQIKLTEEVKTELAKALEQKKGLEDQLFQITVKNVNEASNAEASIASLNKHLKLAQDELSDMKNANLEQTKQLQATKGELLATQNTISQLTLEREHHRRQAAAAKLELSNLQAEANLAFVSRLESEDKIIQAELTLSRASLERERQNGASLSQDLEQKTSALKLAEDNFQILELDYSKLKADLAEYVEALAESEQRIKELRAQAVYCLEPDDAVANSHVIVEPAMQEAQTKLKTLLNAGSTSNLDLVDISVLNALVTSEMGRRVFTQTVNQQTPEGEVLLTEQNFKLMFNLAVNMLGEMLVSNSLDFHTVLVVMDFCYRVCWSDDRGVRGSRMKKYSLHQEPEIRTYFGQMKSQFWEELFWHKLTLSYKKGVSNTERSEEDERKDIWTEDLLLEFSWEMSTWGVDMNQVRDITNELAYFGLGLDNASLARVLSSIDPFIRNKEKLATAPTVENPKLRMGSVLEGLLYTLDGRKKEKRFFVVSTSAVISFKNEKSFSPISYLALHPEVVLNAPMEATGDDWPLSLSYQNEELSLLFVSKEQRSEWATRITSVLTGAEEGLAKRLNEEKAPKRTFGAGSTSMYLSGGSICLRDIVDAASRIRALPAGPAYNQPIEHIHVTSCSLGKYLSPFFDETLKQCRSLVSLSLINCDLGDRGASLIARLLEGNSMTQCLPLLDKLHLQRNGISRVGALRLASAVAFSTSMCEVDLSLNSIEDMGAKGWADCLQTNTSLKTLRFQGCGLTNCVVKMFLRVLDPTCTEEVQGFCAVMGCFAVVGQDRSKGGAQKSTFCGPHRPQPGLAVAAPLTNNTLLAIDLAGNQVSSTQRLEQVLALRKATA